MDYMLFGLVLLLDKDNKVLLLHRSPSNTMPNHYGLVGGKVEFGEKPQDAAIREAQEEVGVILKREDLEFVNVYYGTTTIGKCNCVVFTYVARSWQGTPTNLEPEKHTAMAWWPRDQLPAPLLRIHKPILEAYKNGVRYIEEK